MNIELIVTDAEEYANELDMVVDYDETGDSSMLSMPEYEALNKILSCEVATYVMRRTTGVDGLSIDYMTDVRRSLINEYEKTFNKKYNYPNQDID